MNLSTTVVALVHTARKTGQVLLILSVFILLLLIAAGTGLFHPASWLARVELAATNGDIHISAGMQARSSQSGDQFAATNGDIQVGGAQFAATEGDIRIGS